MKEPSTPGELILESIQGLSEEQQQEFTQQEIAEKLGTTRKTLNALLNNRQSITAPMAIKLDSIFRGGAHFWLTVQANYDLKQLGYKRSV